MAKKKVVDVEQQRQNLLSNSLKQHEENIAWGITPLKPTRKFKIGEEVLWGAHSQVFIRESYHNGLYYRVEAMNVKRDSKNPPSNEYHIAEWNELYHPEQVKETAFKEEETYRIRFSNSSIDSLLHRVYHAGVDFDVEYQRGHVWKLEDKIALIDSIFNNIDIGKFVFVQRSFSIMGKLYEILDGKQRLSAICEFYEDRFKYNGFLYSELSAYDKREFEGHPVAYGDLEQPNQKAIYDCFIKLNTCGKPMAHKHIDNVQKLLNELK